VVLRDCCSVVSPAEMDGEKHFCPAGPRIELASITTRAKLKTIFGHSVSFFNRMEVENRKNRSKKSS